MTRFNETAAAESFIATAQSRESSPELMEAIAFFARNEAEAVDLWEGNGIDVIASMADLWEHATNNGREDDTQIMWGGRTLAEIMEENA